MKVLVHSYQGDGVTMALRLDDEGHDVWLHVQDPKYRTLAGNLVEHVDDPLTVADDADLVLFDMVGNGGLADKLREDGLAVIGASRFQDLLELNRRDALDILVAAGCTIPETESFEDGAFDEAIEFIREHPDRYVFKADANLGNDKTHIGEDPDELCEYLDHLDQTIDIEEGKRPPFILQRFVKGVEVSTERWYMDGAPLVGFDNSTFELKKFLNGHGKDAGLGPTVGCAGNVVLPHHDIRLLMGTVDHLDALARQHRITGCLDLNAIVSEETRRPYILEVTPRCGYDAIQTFAALWDRPFGETLEHLADGVLRPRLRGPVAAGVRVSLPPYPNEHEAAGPPAKVLDDIVGDPDYWPTDVQNGPEGQLVSAAGGAHALCVVTARGDSVEESCRAVYEDLHGWRTPDIQYRTDLGSVVQDRLERLQRWGFLRGLR